MKMGKKFDAIIDVLDEQDKANDETVACLTDLYDRLGVLEAAASDTKGGSTESRLARVEELLEAWIRKEGPLRASECGVHQDIEGRGMRLQDAKHKFMEGRGESI